jgi:hypothetical protein
MRQLGINNALKVILPFAERENSRWLISHTKLPRRMRMSGEMTKKVPQLKLSRKRSPNTLARNSKLFGSKQFVRNCDKEES